MPRSVRGLGAPVSPTDRWNPSLPGEPRASRAHRVLAAFSIVAAATYCGVLLFGGATGSQLFEHLGFVPLYITAGIGPLLRARDTTLEPRAALGWRLIGIAWLFALLSEPGYVLAPTTPWAVAVSDVLYDAYYPLQFIGFLLLARIPGGASDRRRYWLDVAITLVAAVTLANYLAIDALIATDSWLSAGLSTHVVPLGEVAILFAAAHAMHAPSTDAFEQRARAWLGLAALATSIGDLMRVPEHASHEFAYRMASNGLLAVSAVVFAVAGLRLRAGERPSTPWPRILTSLPFVSVVLVDALLLAALASAAHDAGRVLRLAVGAAVLTLLVIWRLFVAEQEAGTLARIRDVEERRDAALSRESADALLVVSADGRITHASASTQSLFGRAPRDLVGGALDRVAHGAVDLLHELHDTPRDGATVAWSLAREGRTRHLETVARDLRHLAEVDGIVLATRDVTERVELERALAQSRRLESLGILAGGLAHDINNALAVILGNAELMARDDVGSRDEPLAEIRQATARGAAICRQLLEVAQPQRLALVSLDIAQLLRTLVPSLRSGLPPAIQLRCSVTPSDRWIVEADAASLELALRHVTKNAVQAIDDDGFVDIHVAVRSVAPGSVHASAGAAIGTYVEIAIADTGVGMDESTLSHAVDPFFTTRGVAAAGLGLSMVRGVLRDVGGFVAIDSELGNGTRVGLWLPLSVESRAERRLHTERPADGKRSPVLIVDDDAAVRAVLSRWLRSNGYEVQVAVDGLDAIRILESLQWRIDALVSDVTMPGLDGWRLARRVRDVLPTVPIILMSGFEFGADDDERVTDVGVMTLRKPFALAALTELLATVGSLPAH